MQRLFSLINNVRSLDQGAFFVRIFKQPDKRRLVITLNQKNQLYEQGVDSLGAIIGHYSPATEQITGGQKRAGEPYNLLDTGEFYESFRVTDVRKTGFTIQANTVKMEDEHWWHEEIIGLTDESKSLLVQRVIPELQQLVLNHILK